MRTILIDNGHGRDTAGKRSPNGALQEWAWTRDVAVRVARQLQARGVPAALIVPEAEDVPLGERVRRVNEWPAPDGKALVSIHVNASGLGDYWRKANGWSAYVAPGACAESRILAQALAQEAREQGLRLRHPRPDQSYWEQSLAMCRDTDCPAVLTENLFMDNLVDCAYLLTEQGKEAIARLHVRGIAEFLKLNH